MKTPRNSAVSDSILLSILQENLDFQRKHLEHLDSLKGQLSPTIKRSYYETTTKLYFDPNDYSRNLLEKTH